MKSLSKTTERCTEPTDTVFFVYFLHFIRANLFRFSFIVTCVYKIGVYSLSHVHTLGEYVCPIGRFSVVVSSVFGRYLEFLIFWWIFFFYVDSARMYVQRARIRESDWKNKTFFASLLASFVVCLGVRLMRSWNMHKSTCNQLICNICS